jgi:ferredoxin
LWGGLLLLTILLTLLPWLRRRGKPAVETAQASSGSLPKVNIIKERCNGCTVCAVDCPYNAIQMVEREDGKPHRYIAIEDPSLCVSCAICVGSCDVVAITMGDIPPVMLWEEVSAPPDLLTRALDAGVDEVQVVGCPPPMIVPIAKVISGLSAVSFANAFPASNGRMPTPPSPPTGCRPMISPRQ